MKEKALILHATDGGLQVLKCRGGAVPARPIALPVP